MKKDTKQSSDSEARFQIIVTIRARWVGDTIAFFDKKTEAFDIHQVKDVPREKNIPKGSLKESIKEFLKAGGMPKPDLGAKLRALGFSPSTVATQLTKMVAAKMLNKSKTGFITLGKVEF